MLGHTDNMSARSVVAVYGIPAGERHPRRLGRGTLVAELAVGLVGQLEQAMSGADPPQLLRVGVASTVDDRAIVEVIEVRQVLQSADHHPGRWAVELWTPAESPPNSEADAEPGFESIPTNGLCYLFPRASFC
jgi:hypothetical protein